MEFKIKIVNDKALLTTPYNANYVNKIKKLGGKWVSEHKVWVIDARDVEASRKIMRDVYGRDDAPTTLVDVRIKVNEDYAVKGDCITWFGRSIMRCNGYRKSVDVEESVIMEDGKAEYNSTQTILRQGTVIVVRDIPLAKFLEKKDSMSPKLEIITETAPWLEDCDDIVAERARLQQRIDAIDALLVADKLIKSNQILKLVV